MNKLIVIIFVFLIIGIVAVHLYNDTQSFYSNYERCGATINTEHLHGISYMGKCAEFKLIIDNDNLNVNRKDELGHYVPIEGTCLVIVRNESRMNSNYVPRPISMDGSSMDDTMTGVWIRCVDYEKFNSVIPQSSGFGGPTITGK